MVKTTKTTTPKTASKTASKATKTVAPIVESAAPVVETTAPVVETVAPVVEEPVSTVFGQFTDFMAKLQAVSASMSSIRTEFRGIERQVTRELKAAAKINAKRKRKTGNRAPSGFVKPTLISNELAGFLGKPEGTEMARTEVTREINAYIREHKLQDKDNGRKIIADKKLTGLLKLKKDDELTYFNLQKYMSPHFAKASDKIAAATAAV
jgi:upstream activation factor subunit UAF30|tara:strand:+ start:1103 stop:1729 length:627 start_codon:yes stop_codon:yes gene_type:complete